MDRFLSGARRLPAARLLVVGLGAGLLLFGVWCLRDGVSDTVAFGLVALGVLLVYVSASGQRVTSLKVAGLEAVLDSAVRHADDPDELVQDITDDPRVPTSVKVAVGRSWRQRRDAAVRHQQAVVADVVALAADPARGWTVEPLTGPDRPYDVRVVASSGRRAGVEARWSAEPPDRSRTAAWVERARRSAGADPVVLVTSHRPEDAAAAAAGQVPVVARGASRPDLGTVLDTLLTTGRGTPTTGAPAQPRTQGERPVRSTRATSRADA